MSEMLDRLAEAYGISLGYISESGAHCRVSDRAKAGILSALGVAADTEPNLAASLAAAPPPLPHGQAIDPRQRCFVPGWLKHGRTWGIACQLYGLRSSRNWGIGDFEDLARLAECAGGAGADFVGVSPLHALFPTHPSRCSPYAPSSRRFLNPLYIAVDKLGPAHPPDLSALEAVRAPDLVDYAGVERLKQRALTLHFADFRQRALAQRGREAAGFETFCRALDPTLELFALHEALAVALCAHGHGWNWQHWPIAYRSPHSGAVRAFAREHADSILFHKWLQWVADMQLAEAQRRARAAGMRIGLYLDLAVGVAPDGFDTWSEPDAVVSGARIGSPPDAFNALGQDWGLAPLSPLVLRQSGGFQLRKAFDSLMRHAGAIRIDHAMGLVRLYLIARGCEPIDGAYVAYPAKELMRVVAEASQIHGAIVVGEDLGTVPEGFRDSMRDIEMQGCRVLYFERDEGGAFRPPERYPREALACVSTHDLPTLRGWWSGHDISERARLGLYDAEAVTRRCKERARDRDMLLAGLGRAGLLPNVVDVAATLDAQPDALSVAAHTFLARTPSRLLGVQLEDLLGVLPQANLPGTIDTHPNWRRKLPVEVECLGAHPHYQQVVSAVARERQRPG